jgi:hypothetical protein
MHITVAVELKSKLYHALDNLRESLKKKSSDFCSISTHSHLPDTVPKNFTEQFYGFIDELSINIERLKNCQRCPRSKNTAKLRLKIRLSVIIDPGGDDSNPIYDLFQQSIQIHPQLQYKGKKCVFF